MILPPPDAWRQNVLAVIMDKAGNVLLASPKVNGKNWHFPQGGVSKRETLVETLEREVFEEVGLTPASYRIVCSLGGFRYRYKEDNIKSEKWLGQEQYCYLLLCHEEKPKIDIETGGEFVEYKWMAWKQLKPSLFASFKRPVVERVLEAFFPKNLNFAALQPYLERERTPRRYLLEPDKTIDLAACDPQDYTLFAGGKEESVAPLADLKTRIMQLQSSLCAQRRGRLLILFHGLEASGRDGGVRHLASSMDPFGVRVESYERLSPLELQERDFIWPLHARAPRKGEQVLFDRSPYHLLSHQFLKGEIDETCLMRRLKHLVDFEKMMVEEGTIILKFFLHCSPGEQARRLEKRMQDPTRLPRLVPAEPPSRELWQRKQALAQLTLNHSSSAQAPWFILPADRKWYRNYCVSRIMVDALHSLILADDSVR